MNVDNAVGALYHIVKRHRGEPDHLAAVQALDVMTEASEALNKSQRMLELVLNGNFDKSLHADSLRDTVARNRELLSP